MKFLNVLLVIVAIVTAAFTWAVVTTPNPYRIKECIVTKHYKVSLCEKNASYSRLSSISPFLKNLVIIAEDAAFYGHKGFDFEELKKSLEQNWEAFRFARGGSTITQQLAKNIFLDFDKSLVRKAREAFLATQIEKILTKNEILEKYLNVIEFGDGIYGVRSAAQHYFQKSPSELNLLEAAYLVYLIPNPKVYSRTYFKGKLTPYSRYRVLDLCYRMYKVGKVSESQYQAAKDAIDEFPWKALNSFQLSALSGQTAETDPNTVLPTEEHTAPVFVEPSEEEAAEPEDIDAELLDDSIPQNASVEVPTEEPVNENQSAPQGNDSPFEQ